MGFATLHATHGSSHKGRSQKLHARSSSDPTALSSLLRLSQLTTPAPALVPRSADATPNASCSTTGLVLSPSNGASIDALQPLPITWDTTCLPLSSTPKVDIHLLAPWYAGDNTEMALWQNVDYKKGGVEVTIKPKWWNSTASVNLQLSIVPAGLPPALAVSLPAGPVITATYTPPADGTVPSIADTTQPDASTVNPDSHPGIISGATSRGISGGKTAAAVLLPLLFVGLAIFAYLRYARRRSAAKSARFGEELDKRMSTISTDWKSMSAVGAQHAIRNSMGVGNNTNRDSSAFAFGGIRPVSGVSDLEDERRGLPQMTQMRTGTGVGLRNPGAAAAFAAERQSRVSRVSFADTATLGRPSGESARSRLPGGGKGWSDADAPPVPRMVSVYDDSEIEKRLAEVDEDVRERERGVFDEKREAESMSPRQTTGPLTLTPDDIRSRIGGGGGRRSEERQIVVEDDEDEEVLPALSMVRKTSQDSPTYLSTPMPAPPLPAYNNPAPAPRSNPNPNPISPYTPSFSGATFATSPTPSTFPPSYTSAPNTPVGATMNMGMQPMPMQMQNPGYGYMHQQHSGPQQQYQATQSPMSPLSSTTTLSSTAPFTQTTTQTSTSSSPFASGPNMMSPDAMLRAYAERKAASTPPPPPPAFSGSPATPKGRKLSIKASFKNLKAGIRGSAEVVESSQGQVISLPQPQSQQQQAQAQAPAQTPIYAAMATGGTIPIPPPSPRSPGSPMGAGGNMAGVGVRAGGGGGMAGVGARGMHAMGRMEEEQYVVGEDEEDAYGGGYVH